MGTARHVVIVGGGQAGLSVAATLRNEGFGDRITLVGNESALPYQRPPLSKGFLNNTVAESDLALRAEEFYQQHDIALRLGRAVTEIRSGDARIVLEDDETLAYTALVMATGATPRGLPAAIGGELAGVLLLRDLDDARRLRAELRPGRSMVIVGGGYIGLEVAATAAKSGLSVTVVEAAPRILQRVACEETSTAMREIHRGHGVTILEGASLDRLTGEQRVDGVVLTDGRVLPADVVVVAIGVVPNVQLAERAGLAVENGIAVNAAMTTTDPTIWAVGDCVSIDFRGRRVRIESVGNATDSAEVAARSILGLPARYEPQPWFWSDQYDTRLKIAGYGDGYTSVVVRASGDGVSHWYYKGADLIAVDSIDDARSHAAARKLIASHRSPAPADVMNPAVDLRDLVNA